VLTWDVCEHGSLKKDKQLLHGASGDLLACF